MLLMQRLIEILDDKSVTINHGARNTSGGRAEFSTRQIASFWLMHAVNSALAPLRHQFIAKRGHPEELFVELSRLAGALCTFALDSHPRDLPLYDHCLLYTSRWRCRGNRRCLKQSREFPRLGSNRRRR